MSSGVDAVNWRSSTRIDLGESIAGPKASRASLDQLSAILSTSDIPQRAGLMIVVTISLLPSSFLVLLTVKRGS